MTQLSTAASMRIFALLCLLGVVSVTFLWTLNPVNPQSQTVFAVYLSIDLVVFAMASYIFRVSKWDEGAARWPLIGGCLFLLVLLLVSLSL